MMDYDAHFNAQAVTTVASLREEKCPQVFALLVDKAFLILKWQGLTSDNRSELLEATKFSL